MLLTASSIGSTSDAEDFAITNVMRNSHVAALIHLPVPAYLYVRIFFINPAYDDTLQGTVIYENKN